MWYLTGRHFDVSLSLVVNARARKCESLETNEMCLEWSRVQQINRFCREFVCF